MKLEKTQSVAVPITPMLDMAFQLLTFFILTYHPMPSEVQLSMNLLPAVELSGPIAPNDVDVPATLMSFPVRLEASGTGTLKRITVAEIEVSGLDALRREAIALLGDKDLPFDQIRIEADPNLKYSELMRVIDVVFEAFAHVKKPRRISFAELKVPHSK